MFGCKDNVGAGFLCLSGYLLWKTMAINSCNFDVLRVFFVVVVVVVVEVSEFCLVADNLRAGFLCLIGYLLWGIINGFKEEDQFM